MDYLVEVDSCGNGNGENYLVMLLDHEWHRLSIGYDPDGGIYVMCDGKIIHRLFEVRKDIAGEYYSIDINDFRRKVYKYIAENGDANFNGE